MSTDDTTPGATPEGTPELPKTRVRLDSIGALIASLPPMIGFTPAESVVVIGMHQVEGAKRLGGVMRGDLPTDAAGQRAATAALHDRMVRTGATTVTVIIVTATDKAGDEAGDLPQRGLVDALRAAFAGSGVETTQAVWTPQVSAGAPWRCYDPCGCTGTVTDPGATAVAAHQAVTGVVTYRSRDEAAAAIAADPDATTPARRALLDTAHEAAQAARAASRIEAARADLDMVRAAAATVGRGEALDTATTVAVAVALTDKAVRDVAAGFVHGADPTVDREHAAGLWWTLTRATPAPEVAEPATLLALAAVARGSGAMFNVAVERAQTADPGHQLSYLIAAAVEATGKPADVEKAMITAAREAAWALGL